MAQANGNGGNELATFGDSGTRMATSLAMDTPAGRRSLVAAMSGDVLSLTESIGQELNLTDFLVHEYDKVDEKTGQVNRLTRLVVFDKDGTPLACVSKTLLNSLKHLVFAFGPPPWKTPLKVRVKMKRKGDNVQVYWFEPVE